jgi:hypothetical protein
LRGPRGGAADARGHFRGLVQGFDRPFVLLPICPPLPASKQLLGPIRKVGTHSHTRLETPIWVHAAAAGSLFQGAANKTALPADPGSYGVSIPNVLGAGAREPKFPHSARNCFSRTTVHLYTRWLKLFKKTGPVRHAPLVKWYDPRLPSE